MRVVHRRGNISDWGSGGKRHDGDALSLLVDMEKQAGVVTGYVGLW